MADLYTLTADDVAMLRTMLEEARTRRRNTAQRPGVGPDDYPTSGGYVAMVPDGGIPAMDEDGVMGRAACDLYRRDGDGLVPAGLSVTVYNAVLIGVQGDGYCPVVRDRYGTWYVTAADAADATRYTRGLVNADDENEQELGGDKRLYGTLTVTESDPAHDAVIVLAGANSGQLWSAEFRTHQDRATWALFDEDGQGRAGVKLLKGGVGGDHFRLNAFAADGTQVAARYGVEDATGAVNQGQWATVSGLAFSGGLYTGGSLSVTAVTAVTGDSGGALTGSVAVTGGTTGLTFGGSGSTLTLAGTLGTAGGGTGLNTSASTGVPIITAGTWSVATATGSGAVVMANSPVMTDVVINQSANGTTAITSFAYTNTASAGNFITLYDATGTTELFNVDINGTMTAGAISNAVGAALLDALGGITGGV